MLAEAKREAERIVKEARERQERLISTRRSRKAASAPPEDIVEEAQAREREIRLGGEDYADEILNTPGDQPFEVHRRRAAAVADRLAGQRRVRGCLALAHRR